LAIRKSCLRSSDVSSDLADFECAASISPSQIFSSTSIRKPLARAASVSKSLNTLSIIACHRLIEGHPRAAIDHTPYFRIKTATKRKIRGQSFRLFRTSDVTRPKKGDEFSISGTESGISTLRAAIQSPKQKQKTKGGTPMLVRIGENSTTLTPFGSLASAGDEGEDAQGSARTDGYHPSAIKLAVRRIFNLFAAASAMPAMSKDSK
jgi:hypothetical protein